MSAAVFVTCSFPTDHLTALYIWLCYQKWLQQMKLLLLNCSATLTRGTPVYLLLTICFTSLFPASVAPYFYTCFFFLNPKGVRAGEKVKPCYQLSLWNWAVMLRSEREENGSVGSIPKRNSHFAVTLNRKIHDENWNWMILFSDLNAFLQHYWKLT